MLGKLLGFLKSQLSVSVHLNEGNFKYFPIVMTLFSAILLTSEVTAIKLVSVFGITLTGGFIVFPFTYILNCIAVEVYGYKNARMAIWCGFLLCFVFVFFVDIVIVIPPSPYWHLNSQFQEILAPATRIVFSSLISFIVADLLNSYLMAKSKIKYMGKSLLKRILSASFFSILIGVALFMVLSYYGTIPNHVLFEMMFFAFLKKMLMQVLLFPITAYFIYALKRLEGVDVYDYDTNFSPFVLDNVYDLQSYRLENQTSK